MQRVQVVANNPRLQRRAAAAIPMQAKTSEQDVQGMARMACSKCQITYYSVPGAKATCPLCDAERRVIELQAAMSGMRDELESLANHATKMQVSLDMISAIKSAIDLASPEDLTFLKSVLYRYREDHAAFSLRVTFGGGGGGTGEKPAINGYMLIPKQGEPEAHACNSIGGAAVASYYEETWRAAGQVNAMSLLMRALSGILAPGG